MMKKLILKPVSYLLILAVGLAVTFTSCENEPEPMDLPPKDALLIDFNTFPSADKKAEGLTKINFLYSAANVVIWQAILTINLAVPVAAYAAAFDNNTPVYLEDNTWEWAYDVQVGLETYSVSLIGARLNNEEYSMNMYLSKTGTNGFTDFNWFTGVVRYDRTAASWTLYHSPANPVAYIDVDYEKDFEAGTAEITYKCVDPQNELYQGYITYGIDPDPELDFDAYYTIVTPNKQTYIEWNMETNAGRVMDTVQYGDELWHCWDTLLDDVSCPE